MRTIFYVVYGIGAIIALTCFSVAEWPIALALTALMPIVLLYLAEASGRVSFGVYDEAPHEPSLFEQSLNEGLTDQQAADKYGWAMINEMDSKITNIEDMLKTAKEYRENFADLIKGDNK